VLIELLFLEYKRHWRSKINCRNKRRTPNVNSVRRKMN